MRTPHTGRVDDFLENHQLFLLPPYIVVKTYAKYRHYPKALRIQGIINYMEKNRLLHFLMLSQLPLHLLWLAKANFETKSVIDVCRVPGFVALFSAASPWQSPFFTLFRTKTGGERGIRTPGPRCEQ